ncbi:hypothetical protein [Spartinivicinus poritis]|uniref:Secreted protein n=1 Tax=Spartinivicinus poritis TaxID=2994640 RepID=A0ABT5U4A0_9GAMM|nr:hypothetical protein [Spartinivicinus sp. A2-2]MDE1461200.1 hypothetical protein [Spartinivicinus sp. A2-2]
MKFSIKKLVLACSLVLPTITSANTDYASEAATAPSAAMFIHKFIADGDIGQCKDAASFMGTSYTPLGIWNPEVRLDTDSRAGGCQQGFAILDPKNELSGLYLKVNFRPDGRGQCDNSGEKIIPVVSSPSYLNIPTYRVDTDSRAGGCLVTFSIEGRSDIALDINFRADGDAGQCNAADGVGMHTVTEGHAVTLRYDMDSRPGGCRQKFRLRKLY